MIPSITIVTLQVEGVHHWPNAKNVFPEVGFLSRAHRHIFHIEVKKEVFHDDRDVEFIVFKRKVKKYLEEKYYDEQYDLCNFKARSCEMLAKELLEKFDLVYCSVFEDNENGAEIYG